MVDVAVSFLFAFVWVTCSTLTASVLIGGNLKTLLKHSVVGRDGYTDLQAGTVRLIDGQGWLNCFINRDGQTDL